jgi:hypothetical protein
MRSLSCGDRQRVKPLCSTRAVNHDRDRPIRREGAAQPRILFQQALRRRLALPRAKGGGKHYHCHQHEHVESNRVRISPNVLYIRLGVLRANRVILIISMVSDGRGRIRTHVPLAGTPVLQAPFKKHEQETRGQVKRLERVFKIIAARAIALALPSWVAP